VLHWRLLGDGNVRMAVETTAPFAAVGFSSDGSMVGSDAVIGWSGHVAAYKLNGKTLSGVVQEPGGSVSGRRRLSTLALTATSTSVTNGVLLLEFTRPMSAGGVPVLPNDNTFLWATGASASLVEHDARGTYSLSLADGTSAATLTDAAKFKLTHGVMMLCGWGVLLPAGVLGARFLRHWDPFWYRLHRNTQIVGVTIATVGLIIALTQLGPIETSSGGAHAILGLVVSAIGLFQPLNGFLRPHKGGAHRHLWEVVHKWGGRLALILAAPTIIMGCLKLNSQEKAALPSVGLVLLALYGVAVAVMTIATAWLLRQGYGRVATIGKEQPDPSFFKPGNA